MDSAAIQLVLVGAGIVAAVILLLLAVCVALYAYILWGVTMDAIGAALDRAAAWLARRFD